MIVDNLKINVGEDYNPAPDVNKKITLNNIAASGEYAVPVETIPVNLKSKNEVPIDYTVNIKSAKIMNSTLNDVSGNNEGVQFGAAIQVIYTDTEGNAGFCFEKVIFEIKFENNEDTKITNVDTSFIPVFSDIDIASDITLNDGSMDVKVTLNPFNIYVDALVNVDVQVAVPQA